MPTAFYRFLLKSVPIHPKKSLTLCLRTMDKILIKNARVVFPGQPENGQSLDILIENGKVAQTGTGITDSDAREVSVSDLHIAPGFFDFSVTVPEPGFEYKETIESACRAAKKGGITSFVLMPDGVPCNDNKGITEFRLRKADYSGVKVYPAGALSKGMEGKELAEMYDLTSVGCRVFSDNKHRIKNTKLLQLALLYAKPFGGLIMHTPGDAYVAQNGVMNESEVSARLGLRGIPMLSEELGIQRDLYLAEYCDTRIVLGPITGARSVEIIREAKKKGIQVTAYTAPQYILLQEEELATYDSNVKLDPPLRSSADAEALKAALADGTLDFLVSDHTPEDAEHKMVEFEHASFGMMGLETFFSLSRTALQKEKIEKVVELLSINPRKTLDIEVPNLQEGSRAEFVLFQPDETISYSENDLESLSKNSPFLGKILQGKVIESIIG